MWNSRNKKITFVLDAKTTTDEGNAAVPCHFAILYKIASLRVEGKCSTTSFLTWFHVKLTYIFRERDFGSKYEMLKVAKCKVTELPHCYPRSFIIKWTKQINLILKRKATCPTINTNYKNNVTQIKFFFLLSRVHFHWQVFLVQEPADWACLEKK